MFAKHFQILLSLSAVVTSHFILQVPLSLGFDDVKEIISPCDGFNPLDRSGGVTDWPVAGSSVMVLSTHLNVMWEFNAALLSDIAAGTPTWRPITLQLAQQGVGSFCEPQIPGPREWVGLDAVLQIIQHAPDGALYQCAAIRFQDLPFAGPDPSCMNDTGIAAQWIGGTTTSTSSSVTLPASSSSTSETTSSTTGTTTTTTTTTGPKTSSSMSAEPASSSTTTPNSPTSSSSMPTGSKISSSPPDGQMSSYPTMKAPSTSPISGSAPPDTSKPATTAPGKESPTPIGSGPTGTLDTTSKETTTTAGGASTETPVQFTGESNALFARVEVLLFGCGFVIFFVLGF